MYPPAVFVCLLATSSLAISVVPQQQWSIGASGQILARSEEVTPSSADPEVWDVPKIVAGADQEVPSPSADPEVWNVAKALAGAAAEEAAKEAANKSGSPSQDLKTVSSGLGGDTRAPPPAASQSSRMAAPSTAASSTPQADADAAPAAANSAGTGTGKTCLFVPNEHEHYSGPGNCPSEMVDGHQCVPQCVSDYSVSGMMECRDGTLTAAVCQEDHQTGNMHPQVIVVPAGGATQQHGTNDQQQKTNDQEQGLSNQDQVNQPQDQQAANAKITNNQAGVNEPVPQVGVNETATAVSFKPAETSEPVPIGHIIAVLAGALVLIFAPAIYVKSQGGKKKDADADAGDGGDAGAEAGAEEGIASEKGSQAGSEGVNVPLANAAA